MGKYAGKFRGVVTNTVSPAGDMKVQVRVSGVSDGVPDEALPWAEYMLDANFTFKPLQIGDQIWVEFPYDEDTRRPLVVGGAQDNYGGKPNVSGAASGQEALTPPDAEGMPDFPSFTATADMVFDRNGVVIAVTNDGGVTLMQKNSGTSVFVNSGGEISLVSQSAIFIDAAGTLTLNAGGSMDIKAGGTLNITAANIVAVQG